MEALPQGKHTSQQVLQCQNHINLSFLDATRLISDVTPDSDSFDKTATNARVNEIIAEALNADTGVKASAKYKKELESLSSDWLRAIMKCNLELANEIFKAQLANNLPKQIKMARSKTK